MMEKPYMSPSLSVCFKSGGILLNLFLFIGVGLSIKCGVHHHVLLLLTTLGLLGATLGQAMDDDVRRCYPFFFHIIYHVFRDGFASLALAGISMSRFFMCMKTTNDNKSEKSYSVFSWAMILTVGAIRLCMQSSTLGMEHHHQSAVILCDGLIAFWDLGCCLLVLCVGLVRIAGCISHGASECSNCNGKGEEESSKDGLLLANLSSALIRMLLLADSILIASKSPQEQQKLLDMFILGFVIPILLLVDLRQRAKKLLKRIFCRRRRSSMILINSEEFNSRATDISSVAIELTNFEVGEGRRKSDAQIFASNCDEGQLFLIPRSQSEHSSMTRSRRSPLGSIFSSSKCVSPARSCSCGGLNPEHQGPLDQMLSQLVGGKEIGLLDDKIEDDRSQLDKLKASLSIQAICSVAGNDRNESLQKF